MDDDFSDFVWARYEALLRYAFLMTGDRRIAEDVLQDVLAGLLAASRRRRVENPEGYARRSIANAVTSRWRRRRIPTVNLESVAEPLARPDAVGLEDRDFMWRLVLELPPRQRAIVVLRYYEDLDDAEISELLDITAGTVRSQLTRARTTLRAALSTTGEVAYDPR